MRDDQPSDAIRLLDQAHRYASGYLERVSERRVFPSQESLAALEEFDEPLPKSSSSPDETLAMLDRIGSPATVSQTGGRYFGFVNGGTLPIGLAARWLADSWDQNTAHFVMSPVASKLEEVCERWLTSLLDLPSSTAAGFVTGTTLANLSGLAAGRNLLLRQRGWNVAEDGLYGAPPLRVIVGEDAHAAVHKSLSLLGMGNLHTETIPVDDQGRIRLDRFPTLDEPALVVTQAGNVNSGAFDPIGDICDLVHASHGWVHVDGAFGLWAGASPTLRSLVWGVEKADSWAVDAHKTLNVPYDCGIVLCRHREALLAAFQSSASYFQWSSERDPMNYTPSMSKRARAVELWAILRALGRDGISHLVDGLCANARLFARLLQERGFLIHNEVVFNQVLVSCATDEETRATLERIQTSGECWCGGSTWNGKAVIRISVCSWATTEHDIERSAEAFLAARDAS